MEWEPSPYLSIEFDELQHPWSWERYGSWFCINKQLKMPLKSNLCKQVLEWREKTCGGPLQYESSVFSRNNNYTYLKNDYNTLSYFNVLLRIRAHRKLRSFFPFMSRRRTWERSFQIEQSWKLQISNMYLNVLQEYTNIFWGIHHSHRLIANVAALWQKLSTDLDLECSHQIKLVYSSV